MAEAEDEDLREFQRAQVRHRRLTAVKLAIAGIILIPVAIAVRRWAEGLQAIQADSDVQFVLPRRIIAASWGGLIVGGACVLVALLLFVMTMASANRLQNHRS